MRLLAILGRLFVAFSPEQPDFGPAVEQDWDGAEQAVADLIRELLNDFPSSRADQLRATIRREVDR